MGKIRTKLIDDSAPEAQESKENKKKTKAVEKQTAESVTEQPEVKETQTEDKEEKKVAKKEPQSPKESKVKRSKKYLEAVNELDKTKYYKAPEAIEIVKQRSYSKFTGTLEAHINTIQTGMRGLVALPFVSGKKLRILVFGPAQSLEGLEDIIVGDEEKIEQINKGKIDFDLVVTTPQWMPKLAKVARILGPRGIMPNPKNGTITEDVKKAVEGFQAGKTEYKTESKAPIIHMNLGKLDQPTEELTANIKALVITLGKTRIKKITLAPTMGPSVKVDLSSL